jgi:hypothetical protein
MRERYAKFSKVCTSFPSPHALRIPHTDRAKSGKRRAKPGSSHFFRKRKAQNLSILRFFYGAPPGTRTLGPLIKRYFWHFLYIWQFYHRIVNYKYSCGFLHCQRSASSALGAPSCIYYPALQCAKNVQKCARGKFSQRKIKLYKYSIGVYGKV